MTFRRVLDAEMKEATRMGVTLKTKGDEKEAVNNEEEELFRSNGLFGQSPARSLLNTVSDPRTLQNKVFFEIMLYFCCCGRQTLGS